MEEEKSANEQQKYAEDIATIKSILMATDEKFFYEPWVFYFWGIVIIVGAVAQFIMNSFYGVSLMSIMLKMWVPALLFGHFFEWYSLISRMKREGVPLFARYLLKLWASTMGVFGGMALLILMIYNLDGTQFIPSIILITFSVFMFIIAQVSYLSFFFYGYLFLAAALLVYLFPLQIELQFLMCEGFTGVLMLCIGYSTYRKEKTYGK